MSDEPDPTPPRSSEKGLAKSSSAVIWVLIAAATIAVVGGAGLLLHRSGLLATTPEAESAAVAVNDHYLVFLSQIEVEKSDSGGGKWDATDGGPDVRYDIYWRGNRIFRSSVRDDTLLARWDQEELGIRDLLRGVSSEGSSKAARITAQHGETLEFRVVDDDPLRNDEIGKWEIAVDSLHTGDQTWNSPAPGIKQVICRVLRLDHAGR
jgi:hypothetical protein